MTVVSVLTPEASAHVGDLRWYGGAINVSGEQVVRAGWLAANGASVLRATYPRLFAEIGTTYGSVDGTHFTLPNHTDGKNPISKGATSFPTRGAAGGEYTHVLSSAEEPNHTHSYVDMFGPDSGSGSFSPDVGLFPAQQWGGNLVTNTAAAGGGGGGHQNMPPVQVVGGVLIAY